MAITSVRVSFAHMQLMVRHQDVVDRVLVPVVLTSAVTGIRIRIGLCLCKLMERAGVLWNVRALVRQGVLSFLPENGNDSGKCLICVTLC